MINIHLLKIFSRGGCDDCRLCGLCCRCQTSISRAVGGPWVGDKSVPLWRLMVAKHIFRTGIARGWQNRRPVGTGRRSPGGCALIPGGSASQSKRQLGLEAAIAAPNPLRSLTCIIYRKGLAATGHPLVSKMSMRSGSRCKCRHGLGVMIRAHLVGDDQITAQTVAQRVQFVRGACDDFNRFRRIAIGHQQAALGHATV